MKIIPQLKPGQTITSKRYNALVQGIEARTPVIKGGQTSYITGQPVVSASEHGFWAKVSRKVDSDTTDSDVPNFKNLDWKRLFVRIESDSVQVYETDIEGTGAFHISGATVPDGSIVYLRPVPENNGYVFGETGGIGGSGNDSSDSPLIPTQCVRVMADLVCEDGTTVKQFVWIPIIAGVDCPNPESDSID